jgi:hypothetical protein
MCKLDEKRFHDDDEARKYLEAIRLHMPYLDTFDDVANVIGTRNP